MIDFTRAQMEKWKEAEEKVTVTSQGGAKETGKLVDYNDEEIVLQIKPDITL